MNFPERLNSTNVQEVLTTLSEIRTEMTGLRQELSHTNQIIQGLGEGSKSWPEYVELSWPIGTLGKFGKLT